MKVKLLAMKTPIRRILPVFLYLAMPFVWAAEPDPFRTEVIAPLKPSPQLNAITHPRIAALGMRRLIELQQSSAPYLLYEAAILVEQGAHKNFAGLIVVRVSPEVQLARLMARDGAGEADARARIASQMPLEQKVALADWVIDNGGSEAETRAAVDALHEELLRRGRLLP